MKMVANLLILVNVFFSASFIAEVEMSFKETIHFTEDVLFGKKAANISDMFNIIKGLNFYARQLSQNNLSGSDAVTARKYYHGISEIEVKFNQEIVSDFGA